MSAALPTMRVLFMMIVHFFANVLTWGKRCTFKGASFVKIAKVQVFYANFAPISCEVTCTFKGAGSKGAPLRAT